MNDSLISRDQGCCVYAENNIEAVLLPILVRCKRHYNEDFLAPSYTKVIQNHFELFSHRYSIMRSVLHKLLSRSIIAHDGFKLSVAMKNHQKGIDLHLNMGIST